MAAGSAVSVAGTDTPLDLSSLNAHIAAELAAGLSDAKAIRERYGISAAQWDILKKNPAFRAMLAEAVRTMRGDLNAGVRIQKKADIVLEDAIPTYDKMIHDDSIPAASRIDAGKFLAQLSGRTAKDPAPAGGGGFTLNINFPNEKKLTIDGSAVAVTSD